MNKNIDQVYTELQEFLAQSGLSTLRRGWHLQVTLPLPPVSEKVLRVLEKVPDLRMPYSRTARIVILERSGKRGPVYTVEVAGFADHKTQAYSVSVKGWKENVLARLQKFSVPC